MKTKNRFKLLSSILAISGFTLFVTVSTVAPVFASDDTEEEELLPFDYNYGGHTYTCYKFEDDPNSVAIAWGEDPANTPDGDEDVLHIPSSANDGTKDYVVKAIAKGGFRYCDFQYVSLPTTIEAMYEESFAYCRNLRTFDIPYKVSKIYPSTFIDCRQMESIHYTNSSGGTAFSSENLTTIEDHAFTNCIALRDFYCPKNVTYFGESCFQNCRKIANFYFPSEVKVEGVVQNYITVRPYAFADCVSLTFIYFETNMKEIDNYAFVDCSANARIYYNGTRNPSFKRLVDGTQVTQSLWRRKYIATNQTGDIPISIKQPTIHTDEEYPSIRYTVVKDSAKLDSSQDLKDNCQVWVIPENNTEEYAVIYKFDTPNVSDGAFDVSNGTLTIPDELGGKKVKIIRSQTFANNTAIKKVIFNKSLVQICNKAFYNCMNIEDLDFHLCEDLIEISYQVFHDASDSMKDTKLEELILPDCLQYIGGYAFANFTKVNRFCLPANVQAIDDLAFYRLGSAITNAKVDLTLPKSLNDAAAAKAYFKHLAKSSYKHEDYTRFYAVGKYIFNEANCIRSVEMEDDPDHENDMTYTCSFYSNSFHTATNIIRFKASKNLQFLGKDVFKKTSGLREVFLTTAKSQASGHPYPWCINEEDGQYGGSLFFGASPEVVCYVDGAAAPGSLENYTLTAEGTSVQVNTRWNAETYGGYTNETRGTDTGDSNVTNLNRTTVPTYYNVNFETGITYWDPKNKEELDDDRFPLALEDYKNGILTFIKDESTGKYSVGRYYLEPSLGKGVDYIDLTEIPNISDGTTNLLTKIGPEAFAYSNSVTGANNSRNRQQGLYFVLPTTVTEIGERAFFRKTADNANGNGYYGVRLVTYKTADGKYLDADGTTQLTKAQLDSAIDTINTSTAKDPDKNRRGFCVLSSSVKTIGRDAFYNHIFETVYISSTLNYFGVGAFYIANANGNARATTTTITLNSDDTNFEVINNGVYYVGNSNKKMLLYQTQNHASELTLDTGTKALGMYSLANTLYTKVTLPSGLTTIYGGAISKNSKLTTVEGTSSLRYIGSMENASGLTTSWSDSGYTEVYDNSLSTLFGNTDFRDYAFEPRAQIESLYGAFNGDNALETIDFKAMTELRKIGMSAFEGCGKMKYMSGSTEYIYKRYNSNNTYTAVTGRTNDNESVLDLSGCSNLRSIDKNAFKGCSQVKFIHLPNNPRVNNQSSLYMGYDPEALSFDKSFGQIIEDNKSINVLVGETAEYAHHDFGKSHNAQIHYNAKCFGSKGNNVYYYAASASDIPSTDSSSIKYWTKNSAGEYILINSAIDARTYFSNN